MQSYPQHADYSQRVMQQQRMFKRDIFPVKILKQVRKTLSKRISRSTLKSLRLRTHRSLLRSQ